MKAIRLAIAGGALLAFACLSVLAGCGVIIIEAETGVAQEAAAPHDAGPNKETAPPADAAAPRETAPPREMVPPRDTAPRKDAGPAKEPPPVKDAAANKEAAAERQLIELVNDARRKARRCGNVQYGPAPPLLWSDKLAQASLQHALDMAKSDFLSHQGSDGSDLADRVSRLGYRWSTVGENIGQGQKTPEEILDVWLESEQHCQNIMNPDFKEAGAAAARGGRKIYWTLVFGTPRR